MLETKDLILRPGTPADGQALYENLWRHPEVFRFLFSKPSPDLEAGIKRTAAYADMHREVKTEFFICDKTTNQPIGIAGIKEISPEKWTVTDIAIGPAYQGRGYGKQTVKALTELVFYRFGAEQVSWSCFSENTASQKLAVSCGFSFSHTTEAELKKEGRTVILNIYCAYLEKSLANTNSL